MSHENRDRLSYGRYTHTHVHIHTSEDNPESPINVGQSTRIQVYIPAHYYHTVQKARIIARREGRSLSALILDLLRDYVHKHEPGNPQLLLTRFLRSGREGSREVQGPVCDFCGAPAVGAAIYKPTGKTYRLCDKHLEAIKSHPKWEGGSQGVEILLDQDGPQ